MAKITGRMTPGHADMVHDMKINFYGNLLATCSSDKIIKIFTVDRDPTTGATSFLHVQDLQGHDGPVWAVCWAFPIFGNVIASCGYDKKVIIWKEVVQSTTIDSESFGSTSTKNAASDRNEWRVVFDHTADSGINCVAFAPYDFLKLTLAAGCVDGSFLLLEQAEAISSRGNAGSMHFGGSTESAGASDSLNARGASWTVRQVPQAHQLSINCLNWADPYFMLDQTRLALHAQDEIPSTNTLSSDIKSRLAEPALGLQSFGVRRLITGGSDNWIKLWREDLQRDTFVQEMRFQGHQGPVRDVAWRPSRLRAGGCFASASEDRYVFVWHHNGTDPVTQWGCFWLPQFEDIAWSVSFHPGGRILAVFHGKSTASLFVVQDPDGSRWTAINEMYANMPRTSSPSLTAGGAAHDTTNASSGHAALFPTSNVHHQRGDGHNSTLNEPMRSSNKQRAAKSHGRTSLPAASATSRSVNKPAQINTEKQAEQLKLQSYAASGRRHQQQQQPTKRADAVEDDEESSASTSDRVATHHIPLTSAKTMGNTPVIRHRAAVPPSGRLK